MLKRFFPLLFISVLIAAPVRADWREDIGVFRIGLVISGSKSIELARIEPFRLALAEAIGMEVEFFAVSSARPLLDALAADRIEYALLSASGYALASVTCQCVEPLVLPRANDSMDGYHLVAITHQSNPTQLSDLSTANAAILTQDGVVGAQFIRYLLLQSGDLTQESEFSLNADQSSEATLTAFANRQFDVVFGWSSLTGEKSKGYSRGSLKTLVDRAGLEQPAEHTVIWNSPPIPHRPHVIRKKLPGELKTLLRGFLVNLYERNPLAYDSIEPIYGGGFTAARSARFKVLEEFLETYKAPVETPPPQIEEEPQTNTQ